MTEETRKYIIAGAVGVGAVVVLVVVTRSKGAIPGTTRPAAPPPTNVNPISIPTYPAATFSPAPITIIEAPTFNAPGVRPSFFPTNAPTEDNTDNASAEKCSNCPCQDRCSNQCNNVGPPPLTAITVKSASTRLQYTFDNSRA